MTPEQRKKIGDTIRGIRQLRGMSQLELAERCNMHRSNLCGIEKGQRPVGWAGLQRIAQVLECEITITFNALPKKEGVTP